MISNVGASPLPLAGVGSEYPKPAAGTANATVSIAAATAQRSVDGQLQLTTREGDTVTISAHADATVTYASLRGRSAAGGFAARYVSLQANRELSVEVQGDLNEQELAEIRKVVKAFFHELRDAFRGRGLDAREIAESGDGATTLAGFSVHIESNSSVSVIAAVAGSRAAAGPLPVAPVGDDSLPALPPPEAEHDIEQSDPVRSLPEPGHSAAEVSRIVGRLLSAARQASVAADKLDRALDHVFRQFGRELKSDGARAVLAALRQGVTGGLAQPAPAESAPVDIPAEPLPIA